MKKYYKLFCFLLLFTVSILVTNVFWLERQPVTVDFQIFGVTPNVSITVNIPSKSSSIHNLNLNDNNHVSLSLKKKGKIKNIEIIITDNSNLSKPIKISNLNICNNKYKLNKMSAFKISNADFKILNTELIIYPRNNDIVKIEYPISGYPILKFNKIKFLTIIFVSFFICLFPTFYYHNLFNLYIKFTNKFLKHTKLVSFLMSFCIYLTYLPKNLNANNHIYAIGQLHLFDNSIFNNNLYLSSGFSPRFFSDNLCVLLMKLFHLSWETTQIILIFFGLIVFSYATTNIIYNLTKNKQIVYSTILSLFIATNIINQIGGFSTFLITTTMMDVGFSFGLLAISFVIGQEKKFNLAWILLSISALFHIHEGLYSFCIVCLILLLDTIKKQTINFKNLYLFPLYILTLLVVIVPNILTDVSNVTNLEFVRVYSYLRHPHHLVPSTWGVKNILSSFFTILYPGILYIMFSMNYKERMQKMIEVGIFVFSWAVALVTMYLFTEIYPLSFISTLFISKFFKYIGIIALIWYIKEIKYLKNSNRDIMSYFLICFPFVNGQINFYLSFLSFLILIILLKTFNENFIGTFFFKLLQKANYITYILVPLMILILLVSQIIVIEKDYKNQEVLNIKNTELKELALLFKQSTNKNDTFITEPRYGDYAGWFQLESERNCFVLFKNIPSNKLKIIEWNKRLNKSEKLFEKSDLDIATLMKNEQVRYILVEKKDFNKFNNSSIFEEFVSLSNDTNNYKVYKLKVH